MTRCCFACVPRAIRRGHCTTKAAAASCSTRHHFLHVDAVDWLIDVLAGALETSAPILGVAEHPQPARSLVVLADRIHDLPMGLNEARHSLLQLAQTALGGRKDEQTRGFARELKHPVLR